MILYLTIYRFLISINKRTTGEDTMAMGLVFTGNPPRFSGEITAEVPTPNYSGISSDDASTSINPYTGQGPGAGGAGQTTSEVEASRGGGVTDEFFSSVTALFHFDNDLTDSSNTNNTTGDRLEMTDDFSNSVFKFGTHSAHFEDDQPGNNSMFYEHDDGYNFGTGDFTIEMWVNFTNLDGNKRICAHGSRDTGAWELIKESGGGIRLDMNLVGTIRFLENTGNLFIINTWQHLAVTRAGTTLRVFIDGDIKDSRADDTFDYDLDAGLTDDQRRLFLGQSRRFGPNLGGDDFGINGYIDDFRITKGTARYTENFTPPTEAFPDE